MKKEIILTQGQLLKKYNHENFIFKSAMKSEQFSFVKPLYLQLKATGIELKRSEQKDIDFLNEEMSNRERSEEFKDKKSEMFF